MALYVVVCSLFIYSTLLVSDVASKTRLGMSPKPVWMDGLEPQGLTPLLSLFSVFPPPVIHSPSPTHSLTHTRVVGDATIKNAPLLWRMTPRFQWKMMDGWVVSVVLTVLFIWRVSRFPGRSDIVQCLDEVKDLGAAFINPMSSAVKSLDVRMSLSKKQDINSYQFVELGICCSGKS